MHHCNQSSHYENMCDFHYEWKPLCATNNQCFCYQQTQRRTLVSPWRIHCMYSNCSMPKRHYLGWSDDKQIKSIGSLRNCTIIKKWIFTGIYVCFYALCCFHTIGNFTEPHLRGIIIYAVSAAAIRAICWPFLCTKMYAWKRNKTENREKWIAMSPL